jgi:hypothetical protein
MKLQHFLHGMGAASCIFSMIIIMSQPGSRITDLYWPFITLGWCASSWINSILAQNKN